MPKELPWVGFSVHATPVGNALERLDIKVNRLLFADEALQQVPGNDYPLVVVQHLVSPGEGLKLPGSIHISDGVAIAEYTVGELRRNGVRAPIIVPTLGGPSDEILDENAFLEVGASLVFYDMPGRQEELIQRITGYLK
jgi:hypothetical protein